MSFFGHHFSRGKVGAITWSDLNAANQQFMELVQRVTKVESEIARMKKERRLKRVFPVDLTQTGGSAGNSTTQCSFTYTVYDVWGNELGTTKSPIAFRPSLGKLVAGTKGLAYWDDDETLVLFYAGEVPDMAACP